MALVTKPNTFSSGASIVASEHNANFDTIYNDYNGNITDANCSASMNLSSSKLAQITTAGKVSGAAITLLTSVPSGAGELPAANVETGTTANKIVILNGSAELPAVSGTNLTGVMKPFGAWDSSTYSSNTNYQAATDGFAMANQTAGSGTLQAKTDSATPPTVVRAVNFGDPTRGNAFVITPVKKDDYWRIEDGGATITVHWIPVG